MKKEIIFFLTMMGGTLKALPISNPTDPGLLTNGMMIYSYGCYDLCDPCFDFYEAWHVRVGFYGDYVFNRHMVVHENGYSVIQKTELFTNAGYLALNFCNKIDIFATLGVTNFGFQGNTSSFFTVNVLPEYFEAHFAPEFSWSIGARSVVWELSSLAVGLEGQYFRTAPRLEALVLGQDFLYTYPSADDSLYSEWQVGAAAAFRFEIHCPDVALVPYMGISYSSARWDVDQEVIEIGTGSILHFFDLKSQKPWTYALGASLTFFEIIGFTVEGRFAGQKALYVNGQMRF